jgi:hypothetical protein
MVKPNTWHDALDLKICWRFFKYKLVLDDTDHQFKRDIALLQEVMRRGQSLDPPAPSPQLPSSPPPSPPPSWVLPCSLETVVKRINNLVPDINALSKPLNEITTMIRPRLGIS